MKAIIETSDRKIPLDANVKDERNRYAIHMAIKNKQIHIVEYDLTSFTGTILWV